jgi:DNA-directed RNA polymerase specialized sigma24 family protein
MASPGSVTLRTSQREGGGSAAGLLRERYFCQVVQLARSRLRDLRRGAAGEEEVAPGAFASLRRGAGQGRSKELSDRDGLWRSLVVLTVRKATDLRREKGAHGAEEPDLTQVLSREPTPDEAMQVAQEGRRLFDLLDDPELRSIALWKMDGHSNEDIAGRLGCVARTVERRLGAVRSL